MSVARYISLAVIFVLFGCASDKDELKSKNAEELYSLGSKLLKSRDYGDAADSFKSLETQFPYSAKAIESQILAAYCDFMAEKYSDAVRELEVFLRYHSSNEFVPYALYLKAMCLYMRTCNVERDQKSSHDARQAFVELINRFPNSKYAVDAVKRMVILDDLVACNEMEIGKFYQKRKNMVAAIGRYKFVIEALPPSAYTIEAYFRIIECCKHEGLEEEARSTYEVLKKLSPDCKWASEADKIMTKKR